MTQNKQGDSQDEQAQAIEEEKLEITEEIEVRKQIQRRYYILLGVIILFLWINIAVLPKQDGSIAYFNVLVFQILSIICLTRILKIDDFLSVIIEIISQARKK